jgi:hypothetical protein
LSVEDVLAIGRHFDRRAAEREEKTAIGRAILARTANQSGISSSNVNFDDDKVVT